MTTQRYTELDIIALNANIFREQVKFFTELLINTINNDETRRLEEPLKEIEKRILTGIDCFMETFFPNEPCEIGPYFHQNRRDLRLCHEQLACVFTIDKDGEMERVSSHSRQLSAFFCSRQAPQSIPKQLLREVETFLFACMAEATIKPIKKSMTTTSDSAKTALLRVLKEYFFIIFSEMLSIIREIEKESN